jgi:glycosyl transferase family 87
VTGPAAVLALAAAAIALALQISSGIYDERALVLVTLATVAALIAAVWRKRGEPPDNLAAAQAVLGAGSAVGLACHLFTNPAFYADPRAFQGGFRWFALVALVVLSAYLCIHLRASLIRARFLLLLACFAMMGIVVIRASPKPFIDVWVFQQGAADALLHGVNPYTVSYPDIYGPRAFAPYAPELLQAGRVAEFPYPPLTFLAGLPAFAAFHDVRYAMLALMVGAAWLIARAAPGNTGELAAALVLFQPRTMFVLEQGWTEPLVLFCFTLALFALVRKAHWALSGGALGLLAASKQFSPLLVVPLALALPWRRGLWVAAGVLIAMVVPFALSDPSAFWRGLVRFHFLQGFRSDSLSLTALAGRLVGPAVQWVSLAGVALGALVIAFCARRGLEVQLACTAAAVGWTAVLIWNKQSFCNYWWLSSGLLAVAAAAPAARETG